LAPACFAALQVKTEAAARRQRDFAFEANHINESGYASIYVIDVEGGGSMLLVSPSGESMPIDSGSAGDLDPQRIWAATRAAGLTKMNSVHDAL
jgi:hypothetical protein